MDKRCIGIEIDQAYLRAVQIVGAPEGFHIEKVFSTATRRESDSLPDTLRSLFSTHGFDRRAEVAVSMPHDLVFFRNIQTDASGLGQLRNGVIDALENSFPIPIAEVVAQVCSSHKCDDDKYSVLTAAVSRTSLREMQNLLDSASVRCRLVETPACAILLALAVHHPQIKSGSAIVVHVDDACLTLAVIAENDVMMVRNIPIALPSDGDADSIQKTLAATIASEAQITWHKSFGAAMDAEAKVFLLADPGDCGSLESFVASNLKCSVTIPDLSAGTLTSTAGKAGLPYCVAEGLALRILEPEKTKGINFLDAGKDEAAPPINIKKELVTYSALVAVFIVLLLVGIFTQLSRLEAAYTDVKADIHDTFTAALPEEALSPRWSRSLILFARTMSFMIPSVRMLWARFESCEQSAWSSPHRRA